MNKKICQIISLSVLVFALPTISLSMQNNKKDETPLFTAIANNKLKDVEYYLQQGADRNQRNKDGKSPLDLAVKLHHQDIVKLLLTYGANPELGITYENSSALNIAAQNYMKFEFQEENKELIIILIEYLSSFKYQPEKQLKILCQSDKSFKSVVLNFLITMKVALPRIKIPKPLNYDFLLRTWALQNPDDYRCKIWIGDTQLTIKEFIKKSLIIQQINQTLQINKKFSIWFDKNNNTNFDKQTQASIEIKNLLEKY